MQPIDALTQKDKDTIRNYIYSAGQVDCAPIEQVLRVWNANKKTLFRAFGNKLSISKEIKIEKNQSTVIRKLSAIYCPYFINSKTDKISASKHLSYLKDYCKHDFVASITHYWAKKDYPVADLFFLTRLFSFNNLVKGYINNLNSDTPYKFNSFKCTIKNGMRTIRTLQKVIKATGYPDLDLFQEWCNEINLVNTNTDFKTKLVLSINPIDFMTMSDNNCNWRSCMSWIGSGCYRAGTLEMMNSNVAIVAYLEGSPTFKVYNSDNEYLISNKSWRSLFYVHKHIILSGKAYPYQNRDLSISILNWLRQLVKDNLNWNYQFINQPYKDVCHIDGNFYLRDYFDVDHDKNKKHHCIFVYTNGMYNDIIEDHNEYLCCRNYVKYSIKLCLSGPATCICCGDIIASREDIYSYDDLGDHLICDICRTKNKCSNCGIVHYHIPYRFHYKNFCSKECAKDIIVFPDRNDVMCNKDALQFGRQSIVAIFFDDVNEKLFSKTDIVKDFKNLDKTNINHWINTIQLKYSDIFKVYRVPLGLTGYQYADINQWPLYFSETNDGSYKLYIYERQWGNSSLIERNILNLKKRISLLDWLSERRDN